MASQASIDNGFAEESAPVAVARNTSEVLVDAITLAELQAQLAQLDLQAALVRWKRSFLFVLTGSVLLLAALPPLILAAGHGLAAAFALELWASHGIAAGVALVIAAILIGWGIRKLESPKASFARSREEWRQNLVWLKKTLRQSGKPRSPVHRRYRDDD